MHQSWIVVVCFWLALIVPVDGVSQDKIRPLKVVFVSGGTGHSNSSVT